LPSFSSSQKLASASVDTAWTSSKSPTVASRSSTTPCNCGRSSTSNNFTGTSTSLVSLHHPPSSNPSRHSCPFTTAALLVVSKGNPSRWRAARQLLLQPLALSHFLRQQVGHDLQFI